MEITVLVPSYRRSDDLRRCLKALRNQERRPDEVLVVHRHEDADTREVVDEAAPGMPMLRSVVTNGTGVVAALNTGLESARGDILVFTDDDAVARPDWLARLEHHYLEDEHVGAVGGRDWVHHGSHVDVGVRRVVGKVQWFGRVIGHHHRGVGPPREVDVLKGVNMSVRRRAVEALEIDTRLWGSGAQVHWELALCLSLRERGWKLIYDPAAAVDHYVAQRFDEDQRYRFNRRAQRNKVHNETLILLEHLNPVQRVAFLSWAVLVGTRSAFGLLQALRFLPREGPTVTAKLQASLRGRLDGYRSWRSAST